MSKPHVLYRMFNQDGELLYVGLTNNPKTRFSNHSLAKPWFGEVANITVQTFPTREALAAAEYEAIRDESPRYNIMCAPVRQPYSDPAPTPKCPTCRAPNPRSMPLEEEELLDENGRLIPFCTDPYHFPGVKRAKLVHENRDLLRKAGLLRLSAEAERRLALQREALEKVGEMLTLAEESS